MKILQEEKVASWINLKSIRTLMVVAVEQDIIFYQLDVTTTQTTLKKQLLRNGVYQELTEAPDDTESISRKFPASFWNGGIDARYESIGPKRQARQTRIKLQ